MFEKSITKRFGVGERAQRTGQSGWRSVARNALFRSLAESNTKPNAVQLGANDSKVLDGLRDELPRLRAGQTESGAGEAKDRIFYSRASESLIKHNMSILKELDARSQAIVNSPPKALPPSQTVVPRIYPFRCLNSAVSEALQERLGNPPVDLSKIEF
jgi:hypothetical protein